MSYAGRTSSGSSASGVSDTSVSSVSGFVRDVVMTSALLVSDWGISVNPGTRFVWGTVFQVEERLKTVLQSKANALTSLQSGISVGRLSDVV